MGIDTDRFKFGLVLFGFCSLCFWRCINLYDEISRSYGHPQKPIFIMLVKDTGMLLAALLGFGFGLELQGLKNAVVFYLLGLFIALMWGFHETVNPSVARFLTSIIAY